MLLPFKWSTKRVNGQDHYNLSFIVTFFLSFKEHDAGVDAILRLAAPALHGLAYTTVLKA